MLEGKAEIDAVAEALRHFPRLALGKRVLAATAVDDSVTATVSVLLMDAVAEDGAINVVVTVAVTVEATA